MNHLVFRSTEMLKVFLQNGEKHTHILYSISVFLLIEVVVKCRHVRLFEIGLERQTSATRRKIHKSLQTAKNDSSSAG